MSLIEDAIINRATNGPNVSPIIGARCYAFKLPASPTFPAMTFLRLKTTREHAMGTEPLIAHAEHLPVRGFRQVHRRPTSVKNFGSDA